MQVKVVLFGHLARLLPEGSAGRGTVDVPEGASAGEVLDRLDVPADARTYLVADGERTTEDQALRDGSELRVVIPLGGG